MSKKYLSYDKALRKLQAYCAYQERCHKEVRQKLLDLGIYGDDLEQIITELIEGNFLNELRYAIAFAGGKFRVKRWGRLKIKRALQQNHISTYCIRKALASELPEADYKTTLLQVLQKKNRLTKARNDYERRQKLALYALERGYESELVWPLVRGLDLTEDSDSMEE